MKTAGFSSYTLKLYVALSRFFVTAFYGTENYVP